MGFVLNKTSILNGIYFICYYTGLTRLFFWINREQIVVINYHNVIPDHLYDRSVHLSYSHARSIFKQQARLISSRFHPSKWPAPPRGRGRCIITFDDGFKNQWFVAGPILKEYKLPAIYFVPFGPLEDGKTLIVDQIMKWISYCPPGIYNIFGEQVLIEESSREHIYSYVFAQLTEDPARWSSICDELEKNWSFSCLTIDKELELLRFAPLSADEIASIRAEGYQVGCHSWEHLPLATLPAEKVTQDFERCASVREKYANTRLYSYPYGNVSDSVASACEASGFESAFLATERVPSELHSKPEYALRRLSLPNIASFHVLEAKLSGLERWIADLFE